MLPLLKLVAASIVALMAACKSPPTPEPLRPTSIVVVHVWHDTVCPWCRIGLHNLETAITQLRSVRIEVVHHPFLLEPDVPAEGVDLREHLSQKYRAPADGMFDRVTQFGARYGVPFKWERVRRMPSTARSHALLEWAPTAHKKRVLEHLHRAYFEEGQDIGDVDVLATLAQNAGLDGDDARRAVNDTTRLAGVRAAAADASRQRITGVPYFMIGSQTFNGAQSPEHLRAAIERSAVELNTSTPQTQ